MNRTLLAIVLVGAIPAVPQAASNIPRSVLASGGGTASGTSHLARFTLGQPVAAGVGSAGHFLWSGFWGPVFGGSVDVPTTDPSIPTELALLPGRPNPFSRTTTIQFDVPRTAGASPARVRLRVYDMSGRLVRTLRDGPMEAGRFSIEWRGDDDEGRPLAAGVYACVLDTLLGRVTCRAVLLR